MVLVMFLVDADGVLVDFSVTHAMRCSFVTAEVRQFAKKSFLKANIFPRLGDQSFPCAIIRFRILFDFSVLVSVNAIHISLVYAQFKASDAAERAKEFNFLWMFVHFKYH